MSSASGTHHVVQDTGLTSNVVQLDSWRKLDADHTLLDESSDKTDIKSAVYDPVFGNIQYTREGAFFTNAPKLNHQFGINNGSVVIKEYEKNREPSVSVDRAVKISCVAIGAFSAFCLSTTLLMDVLLIHPLIATLIIVASFFFYIMSKMHRS